MPQALQAGLAELRGWADYLSASSGGWCCGAEEADAALERCAQAARFLVQVGAGGRMLGGRCWGAPLGVPVPLGAQWGQAGASVVSGLVCAVCSSAQP